MNKKNRCSCFIIIIFIYFFLPQITHGKINARFPGKETINTEGAIKGKVIGLSQGDTATVRIQKSNQRFFFRIIAGTGQEIPFSFENLEEGKWALSIDAKGYIFPVAKILEVSNNVLDNTINLVKSNEIDRFSYSWQDDESYVGHAQQSYINDVVEIEFLGEKKKVPDDFSAIYLYNQFGFLLSNEEGNWTSEESYRLFQMAQRIPFERFGEGNPIKARAKWVIADEFIDKDISFTRLGDVEIVRISRAAFTYANPQVVTVDGVKGKFFSKRLFNALIFYLTDGGFDVETINSFAQNKYGITFLEPSEFLSNLMSETKSNFQIFTPEEKIIIVSMLEEFPDAMQRQEGLKYMVRRINGQKHPKYPEASAIAWTGLNTIEWMEAAFKDVSIEFMQRLVLHEKAHFLWEYIFDQKTKDNWAGIGGWYQEPTSSSGWATTNTTEFVSAYAHAINPNEDMAESIASFITNPEIFRSRSLRKFEFVRDRIMNGTRYISVIRPDLTFEVFNLFPDYNYPGKIIRSKLDVVGGPEEDKKIVFEIELKILNPSLDGATTAQCRFVSSIGTIIDMWLNPINAGGSILRGEISLSKFAKSGYWNIPQITIWDKVGNTRLENNSTYGVKVFINNPLEDIEAPIYVQKSLSLKKNMGKFSGLDGEMNPETGIEMQAVRLNFEINEKNTIQPQGRIMARLFFPQLDQEYANQSPLYSRDVQTYKITNDIPDSIKSVDFDFPVPDYYPSGYYSISYLEMTDLALNTRRVYFDTDTLNQNLFLQNGHQRSIRDSIYIETPSPDYKPPILDLNDIEIRATPTNPQSPNGETQFEMWIWIKDESAFQEKASGFSHGTYTLRDPQGKEYTYNINNANHYYSVIPDESIKGFKRYYVKNLLPAGSPPGIWGVSSLHLYDKAGNRKFYSFVEYVRFDVETSQILQVNPLVEFLDEFINVSNVDRISLKLGCESCKNQNYRLKIYSKTGGNSLIFEGKMTSDIITLENLNLKGLNDGILFATVFILDQEKALIGIGKAENTKDTVNPLIQTKSNVVLKLNEDGSITIEAEELDNGTVDNFTIKELKISKSTFDCSNVGANKLTFSAIDGSGNSTSQEVDITIVDDVKPNLKAKAAYILKLDGQGTATLKWEDIDEGSTDNCSIKDRIVSKTDFSCADLGTSKVTISAKDASGNTSSAEVTITVVDEVKPTLKTKSNYILKLDAEGKAALSWEDLDEGSSDNCSIKDKLLSKTSFTCGELGTNKITFTAKDASGNSSSAEVTVTVVDEIKPTAKVKSSYVIKLDVEGKATLKWEDIDDGSADNCSITERKLSKTEFSRTDGGDNKVTYNITDASGNTSSIEFTVRVDIVLSAPERKNQGGSVKAYPNPVSDYLYLDFAEGISTSAIRGSSLVDASGRTLREIKLEEGSDNQLGFSTRDLKAGMYFLRLSTRDTLHLIKFAVIH